MPAKADGFGVLTCRMVRRESSWSGRSKAALKSLSCHAAMRIVKKTKATATQTSVARQPGRCSVSVILNDGGVHVRQ